MPRPSPRPASRLVVGASLSLILAASVLMGWIAIDEILSPFRGRDSPLYGACSVRSIEAIGVPTAEARAEAAEREDAVRGLLPPERLQHAPRSAEERAAFAAAARSAAAFPVRGISSAAWGGPMQCAVVFPLVTVRSGTRGHIGQIDMPEIEQSGTVVENVAGICSPLPDPQCASAAVRATATASSLRARPVSETSCAEMLPGWSTIPGVESTGYEEALCECASRIYALASDPSVSWSCREDPNAPPGTRQLIRVAPLPITSRGWWHLLLVGLGMALGVSLVWFVAITRLSFPSPMALLGCAGADDDDAAAAAASKRTR